MEIVSGSEKKHSTIESRRRMTFKGELLGKTAGHHNSISLSNHVEELRALAMLLGQECGPLCSLRVLVRPSEFGGRRGSLFRHQFSNSPIAYVTNTMTIIT